MLGRTVIPRAVQVCSVVLPPAIQISLGIVLHNPSWYKIAMPLQGVLGNMETGALVAVPVAWVFDNGLSRVLRAKMRIAVPLNGPLAVRRVMNAVAVHGKVPPGPVVVKLVVQDFAPDRSGATPWSMQIVKAIKCLHDPKHAMELVRVFGFLPHGLNAPLTAERALRCALSLAVALMATSIAKRPRSLVVPGVALAPRIVLGNHHHGSSATFLVALGIRNVRYTV